jgi:ferritin
VTESGFPFFSEVAMISPTMQAALNAQINMEQFSSQLYLAASAHLSARNFKGFAHWLRVQAEEETDHARKLLDFLIERGGTLELQAIHAPEADPGGVIQVFEKVLAHERDTTAAIHQLFETARNEKDFASEITLQWYVAEQVREEAVLAAIVDHLRAVGDQGGAIWYLDHRMGKRPRGQENPAGQ